jgi:iron complex transport system substrate-binding protein
LDVCADQWVLELIKPQYISALSHLAQNPQFSYLAEDAQAFPRHNSSLEQIQKLAPRYLIADGFLHPFKKKSFEKKGWKVIVLPPIRAIKDFTQRTKVLRGHLPPHYFKESDKSHAMIPHASHTHKSVLVISSSGQIHGQHTPGDLLLKSTGLKNQAGHIGLQPMTIEAVCSDPPSMILIAELDHRQTRYLKKILKQRAQPYTDLDPKFLMCPTPWHLKHLSKTIGPS